MIYFHYSLFLWLSVHVCTPTGAAAAKIPQELYSEVYCSNAYKLEQRRELHCTALPPFRVVCSHF